MKEVEYKFKDQHRWNNAYGRSNLAAIHKNPAKFVVEPSRLSQQKLDLVDSMGNLENKLILEVGSGRGEFSVAMAKLGGIVTAVDIGDALVALSEHIARVNRVRCDYAVGSVDQLQFQNSVFDFVVGVNILHHLPHEGVTRALNEAYRVLKPGGAALFIEPIENSRAFDALQNLFPVGQPGTPQFRPSILQKTEWSEFLKEADDRALSNAELAHAQGRFREIEFRYYGLLIRLARLYPNARFKKLLTTIDGLLTDEYSPIKTLSQSVLVVYRK